MDWMLCFPKMDRHENISSFLSFTILAVVIYTLAKFRLTRKPDELEPPVIPSKIPLIGHAIQLLRQGSIYFVHLR